MTYEKRTVPTGELVIGMYVAELDRPWEESPFPLQGFCIKSESEIELLRKLCKTVSIDRHFQRSVRPQDRSTGVLNLHPGDVTHDEKLPIPKRVVEYIDAHSCEAELEVAVEVHKNLSMRFRELFRPFKSSSDLHVEEMGEPITAMVESIIRNPNALAQLSLLKGRDSYTYNHCINMGIQAVVFGRHLGLVQQDLDALAWGAIFCDFGKASIPAELLNKSGRLSEEEFKIIKRHVTYSVDALQSIKSLTSKTLEMIHTHHERFNGSGYLKGFKGKEIPIFGRMAAIVDTYDAIINDRPYARAISPHEAIRELYELRDVAFQPELVEAFIQAIGVYPVGTLVELNTGQVGVVIAQNRVRHLKPKIMLILDESKVAYRISPILDLMQDPQDRNKPISITSVLEPQAHGINPNDIFQSR